jgi:uncharacterized protein (TIGR02145 family)
MTPEKDIDFKYMTGEQVVIEYGGVSGGRYLFLSDIENKTPQGVYLPGLQGWEGIPNPTDPENPYCLDTENPIYAKWLDSRDGRIYRLVLMPDAKWWFAQNNAYSAIGYVYNDDERYRNSYGGLYTYDMAIDNAPNKWKMPDDNDFAAMVDAIGVDTSGIKLKSRLNTRDNGDTSYNNPTWFYNGNAILGTDDYGFNWVPAGVRYPEAYTHIGKESSLHCFTLGTKWAASFNRGEIRKVTGASNDLCYPVRYIKQ